ncbi:hypothetical protein BD413DRAFT_560294 [Trametes elegans]|nr:hypothetical protein BD413DRAFT_560294 [Trametes elegans]
MFKAFIDTRDPARSVQVLFDNSLSQGTKAHRPPTSTEAVRQTIAAVHGSHSIEDIIGTPIALLPLSSDSTGALDAAAQDYLKQLTSAANAAAASLACGSILAGHTSEADEYGDVALWLGPGDYSAGHEPDVLATLGLDRFAQHGHVQEVKVAAETGLPVTVNGAIGASAEVKRLQDLLLRLEDRRVFSVSGEVTVYVLLGRYDTGDRPAWTGLLGLGVQS